VTIGEGVTIGDRAFVYASAQGKATVIGNRAVVGAGAIVQGATLADESMVGAGAQVLDGATVQKHAVVAPGALVAMGKVVPSGQLWAGVPAAYVRDLSVAEVANIAATAAENVALAAVHAAETAKGWAVVEEDEYNWQQAVRRNESYWKRLSPEQMSYKLGELEHHQVPGRVFDSEGTCAFFFKQLRTQPHVTSIHTIALPPNPTVSARTAPQSRP
jgi:carbonic anhydrase/acetyltransferase-like protein (isoleucine patch superfamily)